MNFIIRIVQVVVCIATIVACFSFSYVQILSNNQQTTQFLDSSKSYEVIALLVRQQIEQNLTSSLLNSGNVKTSVEKEVNSEQIKKIMQPTQINLLDWLHGDEPTDALQLQLDLHTLKDRLLVDVADPAIGFELRKDIPDNLVLSSAEQTSTPFYSLVGQLRASLKLAIQILLFSSAILLGGVILLGALRLRKGSRLITSAAWPILIASIFMILMTGVFWGLNNMHVAPAVDLDSLNYVLVYYLSQAIVAANTLLAIGLLIGSMIAIMVAKALFRGRDKKLKEKHS